MSSNPEHAHQRGLRAALAVAGGRVADRAITSLIITSAALISAIAATGCVPKWGPPAPPAFRARARVRR